MKKVIFGIVAGVLGVGCFCVYAGDYESRHFVIHSDLDGRYVKILQGSVESFYEKISAEYFSNGWDRPLDIYYSKSQGDTRKVLAGMGYKEEVYFGLYISELKAIFAHRQMDDGGLSGVGTLYHEIIHRFVELNYNKPPVWFNEGLATFFGEQTRCVSDKLTLGCANPWREQVLRGMIENGQKIDIKYLASLSESKFYEHRENYHPTRALFYWIYDSGKLQEYLKNVKKDGYGLEVLEKTVGKSCDQINSELLGFIKNNCYPAAYYRDGLGAESLEAKKRFFQRALQIKPNYHPAQLELARCFCMENDFEKGRAGLGQILDDPYSKEYFEAAKLRADICYAQKKYAEAVGYYEKAWECSAYDEYRYIVAFSIANCYQILGDRAKAKVWYGAFIDANWEPDRAVDEVRHAKNYLRLTLK